MDFKYFPQTEGDVRDMLQKIGADSLGNLFSMIPEQIRFKGEYDLPSSKSEIEVREEFDSLGRMNTPLLCFAGAGVYDHYTPSIVPALLRRSEFLTSYIRLRFLKVHCTIYSSISQ